MHGTPKKWRNQHARGSGCLEVYDWQVFQLCGASDCVMGLCITNKLPLSLSLSSRRKDAAGDQCESKPNLIAPSNPPAQSSTIPGCSAPAEGSWSCWWCLWVSSSCSPGFTFLWGTRKVSINALIVRSLDFWKETISMSQTQAHFLFSDVKVGPTKSFPLKLGWLGCWDCQSVLSRSVC